MNNFGTRYGLGALAVGAGLAAVGAFVVLQPDQDVDALAAVFLDEDVTTKEIVEAAPEQESAESIDAPEEVIIALTEPEPEPEPEPVPEPEPIPDPQIMPTLDSLRVDADGLAVIAGRAAPGTAVDIVVAGRVEERVATDGTGSFVAFLDLAASDRSRSLTVIADPDGDAVRMTQTYFIEPFGATEVAEEDPAPEVQSEDAPVIAGAIAPPTPADEEEVIALSEPAVVEANPPIDPIDPNPQPEPSPTTGEVSEPAPTPRVVEPVDPPDLAEAIKTEESVEVTEAIADIFGDTLDPAADVEESDEEETPTILVADADGVRVVSGAGPQVAQVALDTITYDLAGEVLLAGRASTDGFVQVYIDNKPVTSSRITADRDWRTDLPDIDTGIYTLRIDELDAEGTVVSRIETPFKREEAETVAAALADQTTQDDFEVAVRTVQPGATLWAIAREEYGQGVMFVAVYEANSDQIRDPDLIYPGQIFVLPQIDE